MENAIFRYRMPPKTSCSSQYVKGERPPYVIVEAKGFVLKITVKDSNQCNIIVPDLTEIGYIEDLRLKGEFYEALSLACTHADFQGKRILALSIKSRKMTIEEETVLKEILRRKKLSFTRVGKLDLFDLIEALFKLKIIDKGEYDTLHEVRKMRNLLQHKITAKYELDVSKADELLRKVIQVLLRIREVPMYVSENEKITAYEWRELWQDLGFKVN